jgi:gliding motility-associated-like protein
MDLFVLGSVNSNPAKIVVYENLGNRNFRINNKTGLSNHAIISTGSSWGDYDNDGYIDLVVAQHSLYLQDNRIIFFKNNGNKTFSKISDSLTETVVEARAIANADMDNDGDLDVFVANENNKLDILFQNNTTNQNWLKIRLSGIVSNKSAIGAKVRVFCVLNGKNQILTRTVTGQTGWYSQNDLTVHFGLSNNSCVDSVIIYWPSGKQCVYKNLSVNRFYFINENCNDISPTITNFSLGNDTTLCYGNQIILSTREPLTKWSNAQTGSSLVVKESGTYIATISGTCITSFSDTIQIDFKDCICSLNMPNAFSPNGDNVNDLYGPVYDCPVNDFSMTIFNRWGEKVFETNNIEQIWDGTFMGKEQPIGVFIYKVNYKDSLKNEKKFITGKVTLIR